MKHRSKELVKRWTYSIDRISLFTIIAIISLGVWISIASTPAVAIKLNLPPFHFVKRHIICVPISILIIVVISLFYERNIRKIAMYGYVFCIILLICVAIFGVEIKGAKRWLNVFGFSLQPSEFLKPVLAVITAWFISEQYMDRKFPGVILSFISLCIAIPFLLFQPDIGMTVVLVSTWVSQLFISGISVSMLIFLGVIVLSAVSTMYFIFPHFAERMQLFISGEGEMYQVKKSLEAFRSGGFWGKGPGEGIVKTLVPDAHSDFVFAVIGEEFGFILCFIIIILFITFIVRSLSNIMKSSNIFNITVVFGLVFQIALQILINLATSLNLMPTKGMTLPFISYGGSSFITTAISIGIILNLTKKSLIK